jgi:diketogulonate reductase-like aldo/keto reductase
MNSVDVVTRADVPTLLAHGAAIPAVGLGTADLGGEAGRAAVETALRLGYRFLDAARKYGTEAEVGEGIRASGVAREKIFLLTKVSHEHLHAADFRKSAEESLKALRVDYVDLLLVHWPNPVIPLAETMGALADAKRRGLARHVGLANFTLPLIEDAVKLCPEPLVCNQVEFQPYLDQSKIHAACRRHGMVLIGYSPFMRAGQATARSPATRLQILQDPLIAKIAQAHGKTPGQIILRWATQHEGVAVIPRSSNPERLRQNLDIFDITLTADEMAQIGALRAHNIRRATPAHAPVWDAP